MSNSSQKNLIIVESPTKAKTISKFLGGDFEVESSFGHVRDLPKSKLGVDTENNFLPQYIIPLKSKKKVSFLKKKAEKAMTIILATDEDREGEAIAWHLSQALGLNAKPISNFKFQISKEIQSRQGGTKNKTQSHVVQRIVFHEITKKAIEEALKNPREIDLNLVDAQQARRILDRIVGYKLSPFLWKKIMSKLSAGRVQSVALRIIVDREREVQTFKPQKYFGVESLLKKKNGKKEEEFLAELYAINGKNIPKPGILSDEEANKIISNLKKSDWKVSDIEKRIKKKSPRPPFTTSSLQQSAWNGLKFSAKKTMIVAQQLYEGVELIGKGQTGLITYMRTDSLNLSEDSLISAKDYIGHKFGNDYAISAPRRFKTRSKNAQEAHEAIRPSSVDLDPESVKASLSLEQYKLYKLIWQRFLATQMAEAVLEETGASILVNEPGKDDSYLFEIKGATIKFDGFLKVYPLQIEEKILPFLQKDEELEALEIYLKEHETQPPPRFNEASLVKTLEKFGIGRPSTYAPIISTIQDRGYVVRNKNKSFEPTEVGVRVTDLLKEHFSNIVDINFTAKMEEDLDRIADGEEKWQPVVQDFYEPFEKNLTLKYKEVMEQKFTEETNEKCEKCGKNLLIKMGRFGRFMACSGFPECKFTKSFQKEDLGVCPKCGKGKTTEKKVKKSGKLFYGCSEYPKCDFASWEKPKTEDEKEKNE